MNIFSLDFGIKVGWASSVHREGVGRIVTSGVKKLVVPRGTSSDVRLLLFEKWLNDIILLKKPKLVIYELPHMRGGHASDFLLGLMTIVKMVCSKDDILYMSVHSGKLKKFITGHGNASKEEMILFAEQLHGTVIDDNQADALHLLTYAIENVDSTT